MSIEMTSRERVLNAINHQEPDRVPLDIGGGSSTNIVVEAYEKLEKYLEVSGDTGLFNKMLRLAKPAEKILLRLGSDVRPLIAKPPLSRNIMPSEPGTFIDIWGIKRKQVFYGENCFYWEQISSPLAESSLEELEKYSWPDPLDAGYTQGLAEDARTLFENTDYAIMADGGFKSFWEQGYMLRGFEQLLMDIAADQEYVSALMAKLLEINMAGTGRFLDAAGPYIQVFRMGDDLAAQNGPLMAPETFRRILKPVYKKYIDFVKSKTEAKIFFHSCGNVVEFIDDLVEVGVDIINPVQVSAMNDTAALKRRFGDRIVFWGGIDTQHILPNGSPEDVEMEVKQRIHDLGKNGGLVLASVQNIQADVPPQNIVDMADAIRKYGRFPFM